MRVTRTTRPEVYELPCGCVLRATADNLEILERECVEYRVIEGEMQPDILWRGHIHGQLPEEAKRLTVEYFEDEDD